MVPAGPAPLSALGRDALSLLAHVYLHHHRPADAAALLAALPLVGGNSVQAQRVLSFALLRAGRPDAALAEAESLLSGSGSLSDQDRVFLLHVASRSCLALGRADDARARYMEARHLVRNAVLGQHPTDRQHQARKHRK